MLPLVRSDLLRGVETDRAVVKVPVVSIQLPNRARLRTAERAAP